MRDLGPRDFEHYVGIPWKDGGRTHDGVDCWGLFWLVYKEAFNIELPTYSEDYTTALDKVTITRLIDGKPDNWIPTIAPIVGDGVMMIVGLRPHIGVYIGEDFVLHIEKGSMGAVIDKNNSMRLKNMIEGYYRYHEYQIA